MAPVTYPAGVVPVEIFTMICGYLPWEDLQSLRLVNREFDRQVSGNLFRNVVVPFQPELYSPSRYPSGETTAQAEEAVASQSPAEAIVSPGMRIFKDFGEHVSRFALSLELDQNALVYPPFKPTQTIVAADWGVYRWPREDYVRYAHLESLENTADETALMTEALRNLSKVKELGLCFDAGLGYLYWPGPNGQVPAASRRPQPVFGLRDSSYRPLQDRLISAGTKPLSESSEKTRKLYTCEDKEEFNYTILQAMVLDAGYSQEQVPDLIRVLLATEGTSLLNLQLDVGAKRSPEEYGYSPIWNDAEYFIPFIPKHLTQAQKEMLLESEWTHRALIQSYVLSIVDSSHAGRFDLVTTLTIAKIPSSHIPLLQRHDLWNALPNVDKLTLVVVADWRGVAVDGPDGVTTPDVSPLDAVEKVFTLLRRFVAIRTNIQTFHFEWICGGEFAPGASQRSRYILPLPFATPSDMVSNDIAKRPQDYLCLPFVKHMSLKNGYFSPHLFTEIIRSVALTSLETLELETVSLTGPPQVPQGGNVPPFAMLALVPALVPPPALFQQPQMQPVPYIPGRTAAPWSWPWIINIFTPKRRLACNSPGNSLAGSASPATIPPSVFSKGAAGQGTHNALVQLAQFIPRARSFRTEARRGMFMLRRMSFKSCGYVAIISPEIDTNAVNSPGHQVPQHLSGLEVSVETPIRVRGQRADAQPYVQVCLDCLAAETTRYIPLTEEGQLAEEWHMSLGWRGVYNEEVIKAAKDDGFVEPGAGRFSGVQELVQPQGHQSPHDYSKLADEMGHLDLEGSDEDAGEEVDEDET